MIRFILINLLVISVNANAKYTFGIYTDQKSQAKANEVIKYFNTVVPFNEFNFDFIIFSIDSTKLNCKPMFGINRLIDCDKSYISMKAARDGVDQAFIVSDSKRYGGSGGSIPVITSSKKTPVSMIVHEYLHTLGFGDEYAYSKSEARLYCTKKEMDKYLNLTIIEPLKDGYESDIYARTVHSSDISWYPDIKPSTPISSSLLGTPDEKKGSIGLFSAKSCANAAEKVRLWKPGHLTIMEKLSAPIGELTPMLRRALSSLNGEDSDFEEYDIENTKINCEERGMEYRLTPGLIKLDRLFFDM